MSKLTSDLEALRRTARTVSALAWGVAAIIMIYGVPIVYRFLVHHDVPKQTAWLLSLAVDGALAVGLIATPILARYGVKSGWIGFLRWAAGFATWSLNTAEAWMKDGGPDMGGVFSHSWGPLMMFFAVEGAAYFQRKIAEVIRRLEDEAADAEKKQRDDRAERAEMANRLHALTAELDAAHTREVNLTEQIATVKANGEAAVEAVKVELDAVKAERETLRVALTDATEKADAKLSETVTALKVKHSEQLARLRAETQTVNLSDYRRTHDRGATSGKRGTEAGSHPNARLSDEEAVQKLLAENDDPNFEWSQPMIRRITGAGGERLKRLQLMLAEHHQRAAAEKVSGRRSGESETRTGAVSETHTVGQAESPTEDVNLSAVADRVEIGA